MMGFGSFMNYSYKVNSQFLIFKCQTKRRTLQFLVYVMSEIISQAFYFTFF